MGLLDLLPKEFTDPLFGREGEVEELNRRVESWRWDRRAGHTSHVGELFAPKEEGRYLIGDPE